MEGRRGSVSVYDYPEHLNPFSEEDNHSRLRFWTIGRKKGRSNSFSFSGLKDFRNTWSLKSFTKKGRRELQAGSQTLNSESNSPITFRKSINASSTNNVSSSPPPSQTQNNRYIYGGSVTPLPRFRFQERGSYVDPKTPERGQVNTQNGFHTSTPNGKHVSLNGSNLIDDKSGIRGSLTSLQSNNPFDDSGAPIRASTRKKRRAPPPPTRMSSISSTPNITVTDPSDHTTSFEAINTSTSVNKTTLNDSTSTTDDIDMDHPSLNIELKIVEDDDTKADTKIKKSISEEVIHEQPEIEVLPESEIKETVKLKEHHEETDGVEVVSNQEIAHKVEIIKDEAINKSDDNMSDKSSDYLEKSHIIEDLNFIIEKTTTPEENHDELFKKVDIQLYKRQQSLPCNVRGNDEEIKVVAVKEEPVIRAITKAEYLKEEVVLNNNDTKIKNSMVAEDNHNNETNDLNLEAEIVKCKILESEDECKRIMDKTAMAKSKFFGIENVKIPESELQRKTTLSRSSEDNSTYQRKRVSDMRLIFDNPSIHDSSEPGLNSPNPIPKPRRSRRFSKEASTPSSPEENTMRNDLTLNV